MNKGNSFNSHRFRQGSSCARLAAALLMGAPLVLASAPSVAFAQQGQSEAAEPLPAAATARLEVRTSDSVGDIYVNGQLVGQGSFAGELPPGVHQVRVVREGFEPFEKSVTLTQHQVVAETVTLQPAVSSASEEGSATGTRLRDGLYGGVLAGWALQPGGAGSSFESGCDSLGATSCASSNPMGAKLGGYLGYSLDPFGFEILAAGLADVASPSANFDGETGSSINPLIASPSREEEFTILRVGGLAAVRMRATVAIHDKVSASGALGFGLSWRKLWMERNTTTTDGTGAEDRFAAEPVSYTSPGLSAELSAHLRIGKSAAFVVGAWLWAESASDSARTEAAPGRAIAWANGEVLPRPLATPSYDLANGAQVYVGPFAGVQFGP